MPDLLPRPPRCCPCACATCRLIGRAAQELGEYGQAELAYRKALEVRGDSLAAWAGLARLSAATGNTAGAVEANEKAVRA